MALEVGQNSYVSVQVADAYLADSARDISVWSAANTAAKERALITATRRIDALPLIGERAGGSSQALAFPRRWPVWGERAVVEHVEEEVHPAVLLACIEEAFEIVRSANALDDEDRRGRLQAQGVTSVRLGDVAESYAERPAGGGVGLLSLRAYAHLRRYVAGKGAAG